MASSKKEINRRFRQKRIEQGLCVTCGKTMDRETGQICSECRRKKSEEDQKTIMDCFNEQMKIADRVEIAVGYTSNSVKF